MTAKTRTDPSETLEIHVLGAGKGESIVLRWPDNKWGVVDCYAPSPADPDTNPTLRFLRDRGVSELEFLCLTHPHDDHFRGMSHLLDRLRVKTFWRFAGISGRDLRLLSQHMIVDAERAAVPDMAESANDFVRTMAIVRERRDASELDELNVTGYQRLYPMPHDDGARFQISSFAPSGNRIGEYLDALASCFTDTGRFRAQLPHASHNSVSVGLFVQFGETRVLLCGDVEQACWDDVRGQFQPHHLSAHAVKVSHHGSETGYVPGLWTDLAGGSKPIAVIAPYRRFRLPRPEAISHIRPHVSRVLATCAVDVDTTPGPATAPLRSRLAIRTLLRARPVPAGAGGAASSSTVPAIADPSSVPLPPGNCRRIGLLLVDAVEPCYRRRVSDELQTCPARNQPGTDRWVIDRWSADKELVARTHAAEDERGLREHNAQNASRGRPPITLEEYRTKWHIRGSTNDLWLWPGDLPRTCSYCGAVHPEDAIRLVAEGWEVETTRKSYKRYLNPPGAQARMDALRARWAGEPLRPDTPQPSPAAEWSPIPPVKLSVDHFTKEQVERFNAALHKVRGAPENRGF